MINSMIAGISNAIFQEFGEIYTIYTENVEQGLQEPCFFIVPVNPTSRRFWGKRYFKENPFCIQYLTFSERMEERGPYETAERLFRCLEYITVTGDLVRGTEMHYEVHDGVLHFFVSYNLFCREIEKEENMAELIEEVLPKE